MICPCPFPCIFWGRRPPPILSFVVVRTLRPVPAGVRVYPRIDLTTYRLGRWLAHPVLLALLKLVGAAALILTITAGFCGNQDPYHNIAPTLVWIVWWVGFAIFSAFVGDLWAVVNPWRSLFDGANWVYRMLTSRTGFALDLPYPRACGVWPAVGLLLAVSWTELVFPSPAVPANIAWLALAYSAVTWTGMGLGRVPPSR
jgi:hypothetical protein